MQAKKNLLSWTAWPSKMGPTGYLETPVSTNLRPITPKKNEYLKWAKFNVPIYRCQSQNNAENRLAIVCTKEAHL